MRQRDRCAHVGRGQLQDGGGALEPVEVRVAVAAAERAVEAFMREALPDAPRAARALAGDLLTTTLGAVGKQFSEQARTAAQIRAWSDAMADMFCAYLGGLRAAAQAAPARARAGRRDVKAA